MWGSTANPAALGDCLIPNPTNTAGGRAITGFSRNATAKSLRAWLNAGPVDRGVGDGLTFFAKEVSAREGKASWILRYRHGGRQRENVIGLHPDISLNDARDLARKDRALLQRGVDVGAVKRPICRSRSDAVRWLECQMRRGAQLQVRRKRLDDIRLELQRPLEHEGRLLDLVTRQRELPIKLDLDKDEAGTAKVDTEELREAA